MLPQKLNNLEKFTDSHWFTLCPIFADHEERGSYCRVDYRERPATGRKSKII